MDQPKTEAKETSTLDLKQIRQIVALMAENDLSYFHFEQDGAKIELRRGSDFKEVKDLLRSLPAVAAAPASVMPSPVAMPIAAASPSPQTHQAADGTKAAESDLTVVGPTVNSPMVGTFYRAPAPGESPFIKIGDSVDENTTVCIIEAMKVMNEIKAESSGIIVRILAEDGKPVQYGQPLFELKA